MSQQFRSQGFNSRSSGSSFRSRGSTRGSSSSNGRRSSNFGRSNQRSSRNNQKSYLTQLKEDYDPPFVLNAQWKTEEFYKVKIPHPFIEDEKETIQFPILESATSIADRAIHYQEVLDLQESVGFDGGNGANLYYTYTRCLKGQALIDWKTISSERLVNDRTPENFAEDIDTFIKSNESRDDVELLQAQLNYMNHLKKPRSTKPTDFKSQLIKLNNRIPCIPGATPDNKLDDVRLKSIFMDAMPNNWKKDFKKYGRRTRDETLDDLAQAFDLFFEEPHNNNNNNGNNNAQKSNNNRNSNSNNNNSRPRINDNDTCPIHGGHKWKDCIFNKNGPNYRAPGRSGNNSPRSEQHLNQQSTSNNAPSSNNNDNNNQSSSSTSNTNSNPQEDNPYADDFKSIGDANDPVPQVVVEARQDSVESTFLFEQCLLDSGGSRSLIARSRIPRSAIIKPISEEYCAVSAGGTTHYKESVTFAKIRFPQFDSDIWVEDVTFVVFEDKTHSAYDLVLGRDLILPLGFDFSFEEKNIKWCNKLLPFMQRNSKPSLIDDPPSSVDAYFEDQLIVESDYNTRTTGSEVANTQEHLSEEERCALGVVLDQFNEMFSRTLGFYPNDTADLKLIDPNCTPVHTRPFPVPDKFRQLLKTELDKLVALGVLKPVNSSAWAFPTFIIPKKDGTARFVSDFRL